MALTTVENKIQYTANGSNTIFAFPYKFFDETDLDVYLTDLNGYNTLQVLGLDYTLELIGDSYHNGSNVVFTDAPTLKYKVTIVRVLEIDQQTDYQDYSEFPADVFENDLDRRAMVEQQLKGETARTLRAPITDPDTVLEIPTAKNRESMFLAFDVDGNPIAAAGCTDGVLVSAWAETLIDDISAAAARNTLDVYGKPPVDAAQAAAVAAAADAAMAQATADCKIITFYQDGIPTSTDIGDLWIDTNDGNKLYRAEMVGANEIKAGEWVEIQDDDIAQAIANAADAQSTADSKIVTFYQDGVPTATDVGDLWVDTNDKNKLYRAACVGADEIKAGEWELVRDTDIAQAISDAATAQGTADGKVTTFYQSTAPTAEGVGDLWVDTDDDRLFRWSGAEWIEIQDTDIAQAIADAATAQSTADGKIVTFYQDGIPTATDVGDLWVDTNDKNRLYRAASIGANEIKAGEWELARDTDIAQALSDAAQAISDAATAQATADGKIVTFYQATAPTAEGVGDLWLDTDDDRLFRWSGSAWIEIQDTDIAQAIADAATAQSTADGKIVTFYQDEPPTAEGVGDIWIDTDEDNKPYRWSGAAWVSIRDLVVIDASRINVTALQAQFANVSFALTIGFAGSGTYDNPDEGDRRIYQDGDEILFQIFTKEAWSAIRQIAFGGVDSNGNFRPFLGCRGVLGDLTDSPLLDPIPSRAHHLFKFNNNAENQHGVDPWTITLGAFVYSTTRWEGTHSLCPTTLLNAWYAGGWVVGASVTGCFMIRIDDDELMGHDNLEWGTGSNEISIKVSASAKRVIQATITKGGTATTISASAFSQSVWHFVGFTYDSVTNTAYLRVDGNQYSTNPAGTWGSGTVSVYLTFLSGGSYIRYLDDLLVSVDTAMDPDLFFQHVQRNVAWTAAYFAADILLKPKTGGRVVIDDSGAEPSGGTWHNIVNPSTGWLASKTSGWTADQFTPGGLEVDFSAVVPAGTKAVRVFVMLATAYSRVYWRKSDDPNISNTPQASNEASHCIVQGGTNYSPVAEIWLSSGKAQFAVGLNTSDLYVAYPVEYLI